MKHKVVTVDICLLTFTTFSHLPYFCISEGQTDFFTCSFVQYSTEYELHQNCTEHTKHKYMYFHFFTCGFGALKSENKILLNCNF